MNYIDLSKRSDFNPSTSHYFWYLDLPLLKATIRDHVYQTIYNLNLRFVVCGVHFVCSMCGVRSNVLRCMS